MRILPCRRIFRRSPIQLENGTETQVLHDRELAQHLIAPHLVHPRTDLAPRLGSADIVQHGTRLVEEAFLCLSLRSVLIAYRVDVVNRLEIHVLARVLLHQSLVRDAVGRERRVSVKLRRSEIEHEHLVIVQRPHAMRTGRLQPVRALKVATYSQVASEDLEDDRFQVPIINQTDLKHANYK